MRNLMLKLLIAIVCVLCSVVGASAQTWQAEFDTLIRTPPGPEQERLIDGIAAAAPDWQDVMARLGSISFPDTTKGQAIKRDAPCIDCKSRPWVFYVPSSYDPKKPAPMLVVLHGSVSCPDIMPDPKGWAEKTDYVALAEKRGWFVLFPMGQAGATWWDEVGMTNVMTLVRRVKIDFNIDDDRVYLGGFSDGGSAAFLFAMTMPTDFAAFLALNGHMGVGSEDGGLPTYSANLFNSPILATTTDRDQLYPTSQMERAIVMAKKAGAKIFYRRMAGEHDFNAIRGELPAIFDYLEQHPRNSYPDTIIWETAIRGFGVCKWLAIDEVTVDDPAPWYVDYNIAMVDSSITLGIMPADTFSGNGVMVAGVLPDGYADKRLGLQSGDVIFWANDQSISNLDDLNKFKSTLKHGDRVAIRVKRSINELVMVSRFPAPRNYLLFKRESPSAVAKAVYKDNRFEIEGSRVGAFRILINPDMIDLNKNVVVNFNGEKMYDDRVAPDIGYMLRDYLANRDRRLVFVNEISLRPAH